MKTIDLRCSRCNATASWIVPRPEMREMVLELVARAGWRRVDGVVLCPAHFRPQVEPGAATQPIHWTEDDFVLMADLRDQRKTWPEIAAVFSKRFGRPVRFEAVYHAWRDRWLRAAA
jgi:hypothetical protein